MSLILDALNKADRDRANKLKKSPSIDADHKIPIIGANAYLHNKRFVALVVLAIFAIIFLAFYLGKSSAPETPQRVFTTPNIKPNKPQPASNISTNRNETTRASTPTTQYKSNESEKKQIATYSKTKEKLQQKQIDAEYRRAERFTPIEITNDTQESQKDVSNNIASIYQETEEPIASKNIIVASKDVEPQPEKSEGTAMADYPELGSIRDLPWNMQDQIPTLTYSEHNYSNSNANIKVNNRRFQKGSKVAPDLTIEKILEDGVIMRFKDKRFKMRALSSWVNI